MVPKLETNKKNHNINPEHIIFCNYIFFSPTSLAYYRGSQLISPQESFPPQKKTTAGN